LPIVYAGNKDAQSVVRKNLEDKFSLQIVDNIRPSLEVENPEPARTAVHEQFMEHVMSHAPGYNKLMKWTPVPIMPTPAGEGMMFRAYAEQRNVNVIGVGLGGATTNIYSVYEGKFVRSVSANLGMSYSICNVLKEAGIDNIMRWIPFEIESVKVLNRLRNKMIRPTTIPNTLDGLIIEHAVAREALRLGFQHHKSLARPLLGTSRGGDITRIGFEQDRTQTYIDMINVNAVGGTGGLLSHAPRRVQSALTLIDGFQVEGVTMLFQDSVFMMPHLGVISTVQPEAAVEIFEKDCIVRLGTCIAPRGQVGEGGGRIATVSMKMPNGEAVEEEMVGGTIKRIPLGEGETAEAEIRPALRFDAGSGLGRRVEAKVEGGVVGVILDARGRPLRLPEEAGERRRKLIEWFTTLEAYPEKFPVSFGAGKD